MYRLTYWARAHVPTARLLLIGLHVLLVPVSIRLGLALDLAGVRIPAGWPEGAAVLIVIGFLAYPSGRAAVRRTFRRRKLSEGLVLTGTVLSIALLSAQLVAEPAPVRSTPAAPAPTARFTTLLDPAAAEFAPAPAEQQLRGKEKRTWRRGLRAKAKSYLRTQQKRLDGWGAGLLIILTLVVASALEMLVLALSCSMACNGAAGAAILVALLGTAGVVCLGFLAVMAIVRELDRSKNPDAPEVIRRRRTPRKKVLE